MKFLIALLAAVAAADWTVTVFEGENCTGNQDGSYNVGSSCGSASSGYLQACNNGSGSEGLEFFSDSSCQTLVNFASDINPGECECVNASGNPVGSAIVAS